MNLFTRLVTSILLCSGLTLSAQNDTVFHFSFDGNLNDVSGNNVLLEDTLNGTFWSTDSAGVLGNALSLTGETGTFLSIQQQGLLDPAATDFTACAWLKNQSDPSHNVSQIILHQTGGPGATRYLLGNNGENTPPTPSDSLYANSFIGGSGTTGNILLPRNEWYHLALVGTIGDSTLTFYVNGVLDTMVKKPNGFEASQAAFQVGKHRASGAARNSSTWIGLIDDLYLIKKALTQQEVLELAGLDTMNTPAPLSDTVFHFSFDGNLDDVSGNNVLLEDTISSTDAFWSTDSAGVYGNALALSGENNTYLTIAQQGLFSPDSSDFTVCAWLKNKSEPSHHFEHIILHQRGGMGPTRYYLANIGEETAPTPSDSLVAGAFVSGFPSRGKVLLPRNEWYHLTAVGNYQDTTITFYVNGELDSTVKVNPFESSTGGFQVGKHQSTNAGKSGTTWVGLIDDLYLMRKALTQEEIKMIAGDRLISSIPTLDKNQVRLYPNPAMDRLLIEWPSASGSITQVRIYSKDGRLVQTLPVYGNTSELDVSPLANGIYLIQIQTNDWTVSKRFVKQ